MTVTCTYKEIWERFDTLKKEYDDLVTGAEEGDETLAQHAGSEKLSTLMEDLESLLEDSEGLANEPDRRKVQSETSRMLYAVDEAFSDAFLFECDPAADFDDYTSSRPCSYRIEKAKEN